MSSPVTSSGFCSCCVKDTITVSLVLNRCKKKQKQTVNHQTYIKTMLCCRFSELLADSDWQHHHHQHNHLYSGLSSPTAGRVRQQIDSSQKAAMNLSCEVNWTVCLLYFQRKGFNYYFFPFCFSIKESISDFYWYYSGKDVIDEPGKKNFSKAMTVAKQIFNTLTEYIQVKFTKNKN